jgi:hypothetical protein
MIPFADLAKGGGWLMLALTVDCPRCLSRGVKVARNIGTNAFLCERCAEVKDVDIYPKLRRA